MSAETNPPDYNLQDAEDTRWMKAAECKDSNPEIFFPLTSAASEMAIRICMACDVREPCLDYAIRNRVEHGIWGGNTERQRRQMASRWRRNVEYPGDAE